MLISLLIAATLAGGGDPDGVVSTAPKGDGSVLVGAVTPTAPDVPGVSGQEITPHGLSTDQQIDRWISQRTEADKPFADGGGPWAEDDRKMHSEFSAAIGTGDFSAFSAAVSIPIGENARVDLSYSRSKNDYGYGAYGGTFPPYDHRYAPPSLFDRDSSFSGQWFGASWSNERRDDHHRRGSRKPAGVTGED